MEISLESHDDGYTLFDAKLRTDLEELWVIITLCGAIFAERHFALANRNPRCSFGHRVLGVLESIPILGGLIALIEAAVYYLFCSSDTPNKGDHPKNKGDHPKEIYTEHDEKDSPISMSPTGDLYGLQNTSGSDCFLISTVQMMLHNQNWMQWAEQPPNVPLIWQTIVRLNQEGTLQNNISRIRKMVVDLDLVQLQHLATGQQDAMEPLQFLLNLLPKNYKMAIETDRAGRLLGREVFETTLPIPLTDSLDTYFNKPHLEELQKVGQDGFSIPIMKDGKPVLDDKGHPTYEMERVQTTLRLQNAVPTFVVQLKRFEDHTRKIVTKYTILPKVQIQTVNNGPAIYKLTSITNHLGPTPRYGHYTNYSKVDGQWYNFNDSHIPRQMSETDVLTETAANCYILNYSLDNN